MKKTNVAVMFGGTNTEHEVSIVSAKNIIANLDPAKYQPIPVLISKTGNWHQSLLKTADVVFPIIHGPYGEDGTLQGMLEMLHLPYVGSGVLGSALCMDKVVQKQLCRAEGIPVPNWIEIYSTKAPKIHKFPVFVKPTNQGSSIGITKAHNQNELEEGITKAFEYDTKVIIEEAVENAREIECSIIGNSKPKASVLGEVVSSNEFYDYNAKYVDGVSKSIIPAKIDHQTGEEIRKIAIRSFKVLNCSGLARIDFLLNRKTNKFYLNEVNTLPGFTSISMYPKLWEASGISYKKLLDQLIQLALENHKKKTSITTSYTPKSKWFEA